MRKFPTNLLCDFCGLQSKGLRLKKMGSTKACVEDDALIRSCAKGIHLHPLVMKNFSSSSSFNELIALILVQFADLVHENITGIFVCVFTPTERPTARKNCVRVLHFHAVQFQFRPSLSCTLLAFAFSSVHQTILSSLHDL